jgi:acyl dehydratase
MGYTSVDELRAAVGTVIGVSGWIAVPQARIDGFAEATGDHQWIHVDPRRAATSAFGTTIAHGYLTLSLIPALTEDLIQVEGVTMGVNYGLNKVRFPAPVPSGAKVRAHVTLLDVADVPGGAQLTSTVSVECDSAEKPVCVAETVSRIYF